MICKQAINNTTQSWSVNVSAFDTAQAASSVGSVPTSDVNVVSTIGGAVLSLPLYLALFLFLIFVFIMSFVYIYHWSKFSMGDPFIKNFTYVYLAGMAFLVGPLVLLII